MHSKSKSLWESKRCCIFQSSSEGSFARWPAAPKSQRQARECHRVLTEFPFYDTRKKWPLSSAMIINSGPADISCRTWQRPRHFRISIHLGGHFSVQSSVVATRPSIRTHEIRSEPYRSLSEYVSYIRNGNHFRAIDFQLPKLVAVEFKSAISYQFVLVWTLSRQVF